jgi:hypothetical protein
LKRVLRGISLALLVLSALNVLFIGLCGGYRLSLGSIRLSANDAAKSLLFVFLFASVFALFFKPRSVGEDVLSEGPDQNGTLTWATLLLLGLAFFLAVMATYHGNLGSYFVSDDFDFLALIRRAGPWSSETLLGFLKGFGVIRPLSVMSNALDYQIWGMNPVGHHLTNILLHSANSFLVFLLILRLGRKVEASAACALMFAVYPVHVEAVSWLSSRSDLLCAFFYLLALLAYLKERKKIAGSAFLEHWPSLLFFCLALASKEMAVSLPVVLILFDIAFPPQGERLGRKRWRTYVPYFGLLAAYLIFRVLFLGGIGGYAESQHHLLRLDTDFIFEARNLIVRPFMSLLVPFPRAEMAKFPFVRSVFLFLTALLAVYLAVGKRTNSRLVLAGGALSLISVIPTFRILFISDTLQGSRHLYLAALGACLMLAGVAEGIWGRHKLGRLAFVCGSTGLIALFFWSSSYQLGAWKRAGDLAGEIVREGKKYLLGLDPGVAAYVDGLPDSLDGAYVFRNGFPSAMQSAGVPTGVNIFELWKVPSEKLARYDRNLVLIWEGHSFIATLVSFDKLRSLRIAKYEGRAGRIRGRAAMEE